MKHNLKVHHSPTPKALPTAFNWKSFDLGIVSSFSLFIPATVIQQIPLINIHPSLLPQWRGPAPIQFSLLSGQSCTGVSIIDLHPKTIDAGHILLQKSIEIPQKDSIYYTQLESLLAGLGGELSAQVLDNFPKFWKEKTPQSELDSLDSSSTAKSTKISKADGVISFALDSHELISRKVRALSHQIPIRSVDLIPDRDVIMEDFVLFPDLNPQNIKYYKNLSAVLFPLKDGKCIGVKRFKIEGKSQIFTAGSFYSNYLKPSMGLLW